MDLGLAGAAVCVQGGTQGMGRATAETFAADGARVAVLARDKERLDETVAQLTALGSPDAVGLSTDVTDTASVDSAFAALGDRWGQLNALVCAVGPEVSDLAWTEITDEQWLRAYDLGAISAVRCARAALPLLRSAEWARIVNLSAMSSRSQGFGLAEYTAAKAALNSITKNLSLELASDGILANVVSPGSYLTEQLRRHLASLPSARDIDPTDPVAVMRWIQREYAVRADLGRTGQPPEIAAVICFLASRRNTYTTGANVNVDGGSSFYV
jgi:NAD(P)-dependent dehydrogenase (short-subunit alcohol dehydrogenase family)